MYYQHNTTLAPYADIVLHAKHHQGHHHVTAVGLEGSGTKLVLFHINDIICYDTLFTHMLVCK